MVSRKPSMAAEIQKLTASTCKRGFHKLLAKFPDAERVDLQGRYASELLYNFVWIITGGSGIKDPAVVKRIFDKSSDFILDQLKEACSGEMKEHE